MGRHLAGTVGRFLVPAAGWSIPWIGVSAAERDWDQFHTPKNLAMAASVEMAELVEIFQWLNEDESRQLPPEQLQHAGQEVGDIVLYLLLLCSELGIDLEQAVRAKLADSERRFAP